MNPIPPPYARLLEENPRKNAWGPFVVLGNVADDLPAAAALAERGPLHFRRLNSPESRSGQLTDQILVIHQVWYVWPATTDLQIPQNMPD